LTAWWRVVLRQAVGLKGEKQAGNFKYASMKVLHIIPSYEPAWHLGGVVTAVSQLCRGLAQQGLEVTVFTTDSGKNRRMPVPLNTPVDLDGVKVWYFKTDFSLSFAYSRSLQKACRFFIKDFDLVHITSFWCYPAIAAVSGAKINRVPYLLSIHGTLRKGPFNFKSLKRELYFSLIEQRNIRGAAALHYTTEMERALDAYRQMKTPSFIVSNGINCNAFLKTMPPQAAKEFWGIKPGSPTITFLGRLDQVKALDLLIRALATALLKERPLQLALAGPDGGAEKSLRELVRDLGLQSRVFFLGAIDPEDRNTLFAASDILALTSTHENFGYAAVEAMAAGVPVLVSERVGIAPEIQADGAGRVVPLNVAAMAGALGEMLSDPEKLEARGRAAAAAARKRYDIQVVAHKMARAYEDILTDRRSPGLAWSDLG
jgi:glycosyltransferase involved in cell wall biosynthesis